MIDDDTPRRFTKVHERRLLKVAQVVEDRIGEKPWIEDGYKIQRFSMEQYAWSCGTPACALGSYAARTDAQRTFKLHSGTADIDGKPCTFIRRADDNSIHPDGVSYVDQIVLDHFGIEYEESYKLFSTEGCGNAQTPKAAAAYIRKFVARKIKQQKKLAKSRK